MGGSSRPVVSRGRRRRLPPDDMSSFFGLTALGPPNLFASSSKKHCGACHQEPRTSVTQVPLYRFVEAFQKRAATENESHKLRSVLVPEIIEKVLSRKLDKKEAELLLRFFFKIDQRYISLKDFGNSMEKFQEAQAEVESTTYENKTKQDSCAGGVCDIPKKMSALEIARQKVKHTRDKHGPEDVLQYPLTDSQQYGWEVETKNKPSFPRRQMDVTKSEGICLDNYYPTH